MNSLVKKLTKKPLYLKFFLAILFLTIIFLFQIKTIDNDSWFVLATGRQILEHGIFRTDVLSMHESLKVVLQNYGFTVFYWLIYSWFGLGGLYVYTILSNIILCLVLFKLFMLVSDKRENMSLFLMILTDLLLIVLLFITSRAQLLSYIFFVLVIYLLELYVQKGKTKPLFFIPLISLIQINLHASCWITLFLVIFCYLIDAPIRGYKLKPLLLTTLASFLVGFLNPYGYNLIIFTILYYGDVIISSLVAECNPFVVTSPSRAGFYLLFVSVLILCIFGNKKDIRIRYLLLYFGFLATGINTYKAMSQFILVMFLPLIPAYKNAKFQVLRLKDSTKKIILYGGSVGLTFFCAILLIKNLTNIEGYPDVAISEALDIIDQQTSENNVDKSSLKLYVGYNDGGYAEFRNYKPYIDPRAEVFLETMNKKEDILTEYQKFIYGESRKREFLEKYDFDYLLTRNEINFYEEDLNGKYELIYENDSPKTKLYKKIEVGD